MKPQSVVDTINICHWTGHGYQEITVSTLGDWEGHWGHYSAGVDIYPVPDGGCPTYPNPIPSLDTIGIGLMALILLVWGMGRIRRWV